MQIEKQPLMVFNNYNKVEIYDDIVIKTFKSKQRLSNEVKFYNIFQNHFNVPEIKEIDETKLIITYERINGTVLSNPDIFRKFDIRNIISIRNKVPLLSGPTEHNLLTTNLPMVMLKGNLVHGDFRLDNLIVSENGNVYLIDFESGNYLFKELDDAYLSLSISIIDPRKSEEYERIAINNIEEKERLIDGKLIFIRGVLINPNIPPKIKSLWLKKEAELKNAIKLLRK